MKIVLWMRWTNGLLFISALIQTVTGIFMFFNWNPVLIVPTDDIHRYNSPLLVALFTAHVLLNWPWYRTHYLRRRPINRLISKTRG